MSINHVLDDFRDFTIDNKTAVASSLRQTIVKASVLKCGFDSVAIKGQCVNVATLKSDDPALQTRNDLLNEARRANLAVTLGQLFDRDYKYTPEQTKHVNVMRAIVRLYLDEQTEKSPFYKNILTNNVHSVMCHMTRRGKEDATYMLPYESFLPWQGVAVMHINAYAKAVEAPLSASILYHGMGSGKTRTLGSLAYRMLNPRFPVALKKGDFEKLGLEGDDRWTDVKNKYIAHGHLPTVQEYPREFGPDESCGVVFIVPMKEEDAILGDVDKRKSKACVRYLSNVVSHVYHTYRDKIEQVLPGTFNKPLDECNDDEIVSTFYKYVSSKAKKDGSQNNVFTTNCMHLFDQTMQDPEQWEAWGGEAAKQLISHIGKINAKEMPFAVIIDEAHRFFEGEDDAAFKSLIAVRDALLKNSNRKLHFVLSSGTMLDTSGDLFFKRLNILLNDGPYTATYLRDIPRSLKPRVERKQIPGSAPDFKFFNGRFGSALGKCKADVDALPLAECLRDFLKVVHEERKIDAGQRRHSKCVIVVPTRWVTLRNDLVQSINRTYTNGDVPLYDLVTSFVNTMKKEDVYYYDKETQESLTAVPWTKENSTDPSCVCIVNADEYGYGSDQKSGKEFYGTGDRIFQLNDDVEAKKRMFGIAEEPPEAQIIVVSKANTGADLVGTTHVYFIDEPVDASEYMQMEYRGVRVCSLMGRENKDTVVHVRCYGFDPDRKNFTAKGTQNEATFQKLFAHTVDANDAGVSLYTSDAEQNKPEDINTVNYDAQISKHNFVANEDANTRAIGVLTLTTADEIDHFVSHCDVGSDEFVTFIKEYALRPHDHEAHVTNLMDLLNSRKPGERGEKNCPEPYLKGPNNQCMVQGIKANVSSYTVVQEYFKKHGEKILAYAPRSYVYIGTKSAPSNEPFVDGLPASSGFLYAKVPPAGNAPRPFIEDAEVKLVCDAWKPGWTGWGSILADDSVPRLKPVARSMNALDEKQGKLWFALTRARAFAECPEDAIIAHLRKPFNRDVMKRFKRALASSTSGGMLEEKMNEFKSGSTPPTPAVVNDTCEAGAIILDIGEDVFCYALASVLVLGISRFVQVMRMNKRKYAEFLEGSSHIVPREGLFFDLKEFVLDHQKTAENAMHYPRLYENCEDHVEAQAKWSSCLETATENYVAFKYEEGHVMLDATPKFEAGTSLLKSITKNTLGDLPKNQQEFDAWRKVTVLHHAAFLESAYNKDVEKLCLDLMSTFLFVAPRTNALHGLLAEAQATRNVVQFSRLLLHEKLFAKVSIGNARGVYTSLKQGKKPEKTQLSTLTTDTGITEDDAMAFCTKWIESNASTATAF